MALAVLAMHVAAFLALALSRGRESREAVETTDQPPEPVMILVDVPPIEDSFESGRLPAAGPALRPGQPHPPAGSAGAHAAPGLIAVPGAIAAPGAAATPVPDWDEARRLAIAHSLARNGERADAPWLDGSGRLPESVARAKPEPRFPWSPQPHSLFRKNKVGNVSVGGGNGLIITLGDDRCFIADLIAFSCRVGKKPLDRGDLFLHMRAHLDARVNDPLP